MPNLTGTFIVEDSGAAELLEEDSAIAVADTVAAALVAPKPDLAVHRGERATVREVTRVTRLKGRGKKPR